MNNYTASNDYRNYIAHHGVLGMKWGVRRYQNPDGTLTEAGKRRQQRYERKNYEYKQSDTYKNASRGQKSNMTSTYNVLKARYLIDKSASRKAMYDIYEKKKYKSLSDFSKSEFKKGLALGSAFVAANYGVNLASIITANVVKGSTGATMAGMALGLNTVKGGRSSFRQIYKAANNGQKFVNRMRAVGLNPSYIFGF